MHQVILLETEDIVAVKVTGKLEKEDYEIILPLIEERIRTYGKISMYVELEDFEGIGLGAMWEDLKFGLKHINDFRKTALVGDKKWLDVVAQFAKPFTTAEIKYFEPKDRELALEWVAKP